MTTNGKWSDVVKAVLTSQIGGWLVACIIFFIVARWALRDRTAVYEELSNLRSNVTPMIVDTKAMTVENNRLVHEVKTMLLKNQQTLEEVEEIMRKLQQDKRDP